MTGINITRVLSIIVIGMISCSSFLGIFTSSNFDKLTIPQEELQDTYLDQPAQEDHTGSFDTDWLWPNTEGDLFDVRDLLDSYRDNAGSIRTYRTSSHSGSQTGFDLNYMTQDNVLSIRATISDYGIVTYDFAEGMYESIVISGMELSNTYGSPVIPYSKILFNIPDYASVANVKVRSVASESIFGLDIVPGPRPVAIYGDMVPDPTLFFNPDLYTSNYLLPSELIQSEVIEKGNEQALMITINPLQYNPVLKKAVLHSDLIIDVTYNQGISKDDVTFNGWSNFDGTYYTIITTDQFLPILTDFIDWKTSLGLNVQVETVDDILSGYAGRDDPEKIRSFIQASYAENETEYFLLVGDCDIVPVREVVDPAGGPGLDNGTEPSDLYYECLDGDWDSNENDMFGEMDDAVDLFPEVKVGRLPVQIPTQAEHVLSQIISYESNPEAGDWLNDFMLIAVDCFGWGDGVVMAEGQINEKYLFDSFFDVFRYYSTDGSLSTLDIVSKIDSGVNIIDFFDHGAYDVWVDALDVSDVLDLNNGDKGFMAFAMACETAAFDVEEVEPVIGEAFFRNLDGGATTYIGATRVAWAGYDCFDGLHNKFWDFFLQEALVNRAVSPKEALHSAINYMATTFDTSNAPTLESIYQAIYFGDPSLVLYWKHNVTTVAAPVEVNEDVTLNGYCSLYNNEPIVDTVDIVVKDPTGAIVYSGTTATNSEGMYSIVFSASSKPGFYSVETTIDQPFEYTAITEFSVGSMDMTLELDSIPIYHTDLDFSGTVDDDCNGNATLFDASGAVLGFVSLTSVSNVFSDSVNVTGFGLLRLYVQFDNGPSTSGAYIDFKVNRGDILIIADNAGTDWGPEYPGGWADDNVGDASNPGDYVLALKDEYNITVFNTMQGTTPTLEFLNSFDALIVTTGDNYGYPLTAPLDYLFDVLFDYHVTGGDILFEGSFILDTLSAGYGEYFSSLFHVEYEDHIMNDGGLLLSIGTHPMTSGLPSTIPLEDGLGAAYADVFNPANGSYQAASYSGSYVGGSAITGLAPSQFYGGVVFIGFSIDAITNREYRDLLIQNSMGFLLHPSLMVTLSDDAVKTGTSETVYLEVTDSATGTPIENAGVVFEGCGVSESNSTQPDGTCSIFINPSSEGLIEINVTKHGFLNFSTYIIVYDESIVSLSASPSYLERSVSTLVTITARDYYEHNALENCFINVTGLGNSATGFTNESGMVDFLLSSDVAGIIDVEGSLSGYIGSSISIPVRLNILVLPSIATIYPEECCWDELMMHWDEYGDYPLYIDYSTFQNESQEITLELLEELNPDVLSLGFPYYDLTTDQADAIKTYVTAGHGFVLDSGALYYYADLWEDFFGLTDLEPMEGDNDYIEISQIYSSHQLFNDVSDPYVAGYPMAVYPESTGWDSTNLLGANYIGLEDSVTPRGAIITYRGMVYTSSIPEYMSNRDDCQFLYNAFVWSDYEIPDHELTISIDAPQRVDPGTTTTITATVLNQGLSTETDVSMYLYIDYVQVDSLVIPSLVNGSSESIVYEWTSIPEGVHNITAVVDPVPGEADVSNNVITKIVTARLLIDYAMVEDEFTWYDAATNGENLMIYGDDVYETVSLPFDFSYYDATYSSVHISSNGWLSFTNPTPYEYSNVEFPSSDPYYAYAVAPMWADLFAEDNIYYWETEEFAVIEYNTYYYLSGSYAGTYQVVFFADGHIEFNYLDMGFLYDGTIGLNHGDGYHYNAYDCSLISGRVNFSLAFYYIQPEHDLVAGLIAPSYAFIGEPTTLVPFVNNSGNSTETDVELTLYIDGYVEISVMLTSMESLETFEYPYDWTPSSGGYHEISVEVTPVPDEYSILNNYVSREIFVEAPRDFEIVSPTEGQTVGGGIVFVEFESSSMGDIMFIEIYLNGDYIITTYSPYIGEVSVPIFENGTNFIELDVFWYDSTVSVDIVEIQSVNVVPLFNPQPDDYYDFYMTSDYYSYQLNFTFGEMVSDFEVEVELYEELFDETNTSIDSITIDVYASILNGFVTSEEISGFRLFFLTGIDSPVATGSPAEIGDSVVGLSWYDIHYITSFTTWEGYAVWETESYEDYHASVFRSNGILATYEYSGQYMHGWVVDTSFFPTSDVLPPDWLTTPEDIYLEFGDSLSHQFYVFDESGLDSFTVNDTTHFSLTLSGLLTNNIPLAVGIYPIEVIATDPYEHSTSAEISVIVQDTIAPTWLSTQDEFSYYVGQSIEIQLEAEDISGIDHWSVDDTDFTVDQTGLLKNASSLGVGVYSVEVSVFDIYDNEATMTIQVIVLAATTTSTTTTNTTTNETQLFLIYMTVVFTGITVVGFVVILLIRRRMLGSTGE